MNIKTLSTKQSKIEFDRLFRSDNGTLLSMDCESSLDVDYRQIRQELYREYNNLKQLGYKDYQLDYRYSLWFYDYFRNQEWMTERLAANYEFWSFVALKVIPDLVYDRFGAADDKHYYAKGLRIWPYTLYWYSHLSWQGDIESTERILSSSRCCSDTILNLVERPGRYGTFVELYRRIMYYFVNISAVKPLDSSNSIKLFRSIMKLALAKPQVIDPDLFDGGTSEYAREIVQECIDDNDFIIEEKEI